VAPGNAQFDADLHRPTDVPLFRAQDRVLGNIVHNNACRDKYTGWQKGTMVLRSCKCRLDHPIIMISILDSHSRRIHPSNSALLKAGQET
jgi:hypothetical protein